MILKDSEINDWYLGIYTVVDRNCHEGDGYVIDPFGCKHEFDWEYQESVKDIVYSGSIYKGFWFTWYVKTPVNNESELIALWHADFKVINQTIQKMSKLHGANN